MLSEDRWTRRSVLKNLVGNGIAISGIGAGRALGQPTPDEQLYIILAGGTGLRDRLREKGCKILHEIAGKSVIIASGPTGREDELRSLAVVSDAVPNRAVVAEEIQRKEEGRKPTGSRLSEKQWDKRIMDTFDAHDVATGEGTALAVIDTGVDHTHPDLTSGVDGERSRGIHNGQIDAGKQSIDIRKSPTAGSSATKKVKLPAGSDVDGHGSHVAGIAAASRNGDGITGVAPDATIVSLRTGVYKKNDYGYSELQFTVADILLAIDYAAEIGVDVTNISLALGPLTAGTERRRYVAAFQRLLQHAIEQGTIVIVAGGNQGVNLGEHPQYVLPSGNQGVISVSATGPNDRRYFNSNYGDEVIDVAAPGGGYETAEKTYNSADVEWPYPTNQVLSTVPEIIYNDRYRYEYGTSMAAPQVSGLACLVRELEPDLHPRRVKQVIERSAIEAAGTDPSELGAGRISVPKTLDRLSK